MNCRDFERLINEQLDARSAMLPDVEAALNGHGSACAACRATLTQYHALRQAIAAWASPPSAPAGFADRFLDEWALERNAETPGSLAFRPRRAWQRPGFPAVMATAAAAAALVVAVGLGLRSSGTGRPTKPVAAPVIAERAIDSDALSDALAEATAATWDLARATSAPAARVGLEVFDAAELSGATVSLSMPEDSAAAGEVLRGMGDRVNDGVRPLTGTARQAFGFLLGPAVGPAETPPHSSTGA